MTTKSERLFSAYARFAQAIAANPSEKVQELYRVAAGVRQFVAEARSREPTPTASQIVIGLEQGLREMPDLIGGVDAEWRWAVSRALHDALTTEYPEFLAFDAKRLEKILSRGKIRTEAEFYLVRHRIDVLEGKPELGHELKNLYALIEAYEGRA